MDDVVEHVGQRGSLREAKWFRAVNGVTAILTEGPHPAHASGAAAPALSMKMGRPTLSRRRPSGGRFSNSRCSPQTEEELLT